MQRTISGVIYLIIIIGSLFLGKYAYGAVFLLTAILALIEFYDLAGSSGNHSYSLTGIIAGTIMFVLSFIVASQIVGFFLLSFLLLLPLFAFLLALYIGKQEILSGISITLTGVLYVFVPFALMNYLVFPVCNNHEYSHRILLGILSLIWINDTSAYVTGVTFGRHKLFPRISPKKSWEGLIGGTVFTIVIALWMSPIMGILTRKDWIVFAVIVSIFGVYGDLTESLIKRNAGKKDSGSLIPGHGGILDRIDSILFVMPVSFIYMIISNL